MVVTNPSKRWVATSQHVHGQADFGSAPVQSSACWRESAGKQGHASDSTRSSRDMNVHVRADDERRIEVLAQDLPCFGGAQLAIDVTLRSALISSGETQLHAADVDGAILLEARRDKEATYPELAWSTRCRLFVVAVETGGRWSEEAVHLVWQLALAKARDVPHFLTQQVALAWERRWTRMLSTVRHIFCHVSGGSSVTRNDVHDSRGCAIAGRHFVS